MKGGKPQQYGNSRQAYTLPKPQGNIMHCDGSYLPPAVASLDAADIALWQYRLSSLKVMDADMKTAALSSGRF